MGADRAVLVSDDAAAGSDLVATGKGLAKALEREAPDLVLFGQASGDGDGAVLWAAVADRLRRPVISQAAGSSFDGGAVKGKRQTEHGYDTISAPLPAVVAVSDAINEPRYPSLKGIMGAKSKPQETLSAGDLGLDPDALGEAGSKTTVLEPRPAALARRHREDRGRRQRAQKISTTSSRGARCEVPRLPGAPRGELEKRGLGVLGKAACSARRRASPRRRRRRGRGERGRVRSDEGVRLRRRGRRAAAPAARRCPGGARRERARRGAVRGLGAVGRRRGRPLRAARRRAQLGPDGPRASKEASSSASVRRWATR